VIGNIGKGTVETIRKKSFLVPLNSAVYQHQTAFRVLAQQIAENGVELRMKFEERLGADIKSDEQGAPAVQIKGDITLDVRDFLIGLLITPGAVLHGLAAGHNAPVRCISLIGAKVW
jgi:hypothetical protein